MLSGGKRDQFNDYLVMSETKVNKSFPFAEFHSNNFEIKSRRVQDKNVGG